MLELIPEALQVFSKEWKAKFKADIANIQTRYTETTPTDDLWEAKRIFVEQKVQLERKLHSILTIKQDG